METLDDDNAAWLFLNSSPACRVAAMELFGTLLLWELLLRQSNSLNYAKLAIPVATDNRGNSMSILNNKSKTWPSSIILMQMVWEAHKHSADIAISHSNRKWNKWADQLAGGDMDGFNPELRLHPSIDPTEWDLLRMFTQQETLKGVAKNLRRRQKKRDLRQAEKTKGSLQQ